MKPNKSELLNIKNWVNTWKEAGVLLDNMYAEELSQLSEIDAKKKIAIIFENLDPSFYAQRSSTTDSGLVSMQKLFSKLKVNE